jgi:hypothetical protein
MPDREVMGRTLVRAVGVLAARLAGVVVVRLGLEWVDAYPCSQASEARYGLVATAALSVATAALSVATAALSVAISGTVIALR